jgi:hypothetical protein
MKAAGFTPRECRDADFSQQELSSAGWRGITWDYW